LDKDAFFNFLAMDTWAENWPVDRVLANCEALEGLNGADPLDRYGSFLTAIGNGNFHQSGLSKMNEVKRFINSVEDRQSGAAGLYWQTCYEFGYYMSADPKNGLFGYGTFSGYPYGAGCASEYGSRYETLMSTKSTVIAISSVSVCVRSSYVYTDSRPNTLKVALPKSMRSIREKILTPSASFS
jgi:hypothetical protein